MKIHFLIGAANSGAGKTTLTIGLLRVLKNKGLNVQSFKCGPDYIDTKYHAAASFSEPVNLDLWLASEKHLKDIYNRYSSKAECSVTEGVMGLFDGYRKMEGSSAAIAALLDIPVVLVINAASSAYSVAPMIYGFANFNPKVKIAGVIFNKVSSVSHFSFLKEACNDIGIQCFGYMPENSCISIPSRHLGLTIGNKEEMEEYIQNTANMVEHNIDIEHMLECLTAPENKITDIKNESLLKSNLIIAIAHDEAFNFTYRENIENLQRIGNVIFFSPLHDNNIPEADVIYLPGGYPEIFAEQLSRNTKIKQQLKSFAENGGKVFAECGGMMYLGRSLFYNGKSYEMSGVLDIDSTMEDSHLTLGYRIMTYNGIEYRGHEFHYSHTVNPSAIPSQADIYNARGMKVSVPLYRHNNVIAGYTHWYWGETNFMNFWK